MREALHYTHHLIRAFRSRSFGILLITKNIGCVSFVTCCITSGVYFIWLFRWVNVSMPPAHQFHHSDPGLQSKHVRGPRTSPPSCTFIPEACAFPKVRVASEPWQCCRGRKDGRRKSHFRTWLLPVNSIYPSFIPLSIVTRRHENEKAVKQLEMAIAQSKREQKKRKRELIVTSIGCGSLFQRRRQLAIPFPI